MLWLEEARRLNQRLRDARRQLEIYRLAMANMVPHLDGLPKVKANTSRPESLSLLIVETEAKIETLAIELDAACTSISKKLQLAPLTPQESSVMLYRYVACLNFMEIERRMKMTDARVFYLHRCAIQKLRAMFNKNF